MACSARRLHHAQAWREGKRDGMLSELRGSGYGAVADEDDACAVPLRGAAERTRRCDLGAREREGAAKSASY
eukprot:362367-Rhodomonas_salina.3